MGEGALYAELGCTGHKKAGFRRLRRLSFVPCPLKFQDECGTTLAVEPADRHPRLRLLRPFPIAHFEAKFLAADQAVQSIGAALRGTLAVKLVDCDRR